MAYWAYTAPSLAQHYIACASRENLGLSEKSQVKMVSLLDSIPISLVPMRENKLNAINNTHLTVQFEDQDHVASCKIHVYWRDKTIKIPSIFC